jgi:hypothetical protein
MRESEQFDAIKFDGFRAQPLSKLINHVWATSPFHRHRLAPLVRLGTVDMTRWTEVPVLRPADIDRHGMALAAGWGSDPIEEQPANNFARIPVLSRYARIAAECTMERFYQLGDLDFSGRLAILDPDWVGDDDGSGWSVISDYSPWFAGDAAAPASAQAIFLHEQDISVLKTTSAIAQCLAGESLPPLDAVIITSDILSDETRAELGRGFGCRVAHLVMRPVIGACAFSPARGEPYRVAAATSLVEVLDPLGRPVGAGEEGELVVTPLHQTAYPLLRLATGILATAPQSPETLLGVRGIAGVNPVS